MRSRLNALALLWPRHGPRCMSSAAKAIGREKDTANIRNIALVAHIDSGKTTLTESILHASTYLSTPGTVDSGSTTTDFLPAERERGITIQAASIPVHWKHWTFNLIDTPGHADFGMEVESASRVVDGAVILIDSVEGVEAQTRGVWRQLDRYQVPTRIMFLNKLDREGASFRSSFLSLLANKFHPRPTVLTLPIASFNPDDYARAEPGIHGLVDLVNWEVWKWTNGDVQRHRLARTKDELLQQARVFKTDHPVLNHILEARMALLDNLSLLSEDLLNALVNSTSGDESYLEIPGPVILEQLRSLVLRNEILPVVCGSAFHHVGTKLLMDFVGELVASPVDVAAAQTSTIAAPVARKGGPPAKDAVTLLAWKVVWDQQRGWMTFVRVYSGTLTKSTSLFNHSQNEREKPTKLLLLYAAEPKEVNELPFGSVGVVLGLKYTRTGDTLSSKPLDPKDPSVLRDIRPPTAVIAASVVPETYADMHPVQEALVALQRTDPSIRIETTEGQLLVHGLGALHLEIVEGRLRDEWGARFQFGTRRVGYRESYAGTEPTAVQGTWNATVEGRLIPVTVAFTLCRLEDAENGASAWGGNVVVDGKGNPLPAPGAALDRTGAHYHLAQGIENFIANTPTSSLPLTGTRIQIQSFELPIPLNAPVLTHAASSVLRTHLREVGAGPILEPYVRVKVEIEADLAGKVIKDLTEHGGEILDLTGSGDMEPEAVVDAGDIYIPPAWLSPCASSSNAADAPTAKAKSVVYAAAPLARMLDYLLRLRALSGGRGEYEMSNAGFHEVMPGRRDEIMRELGKA